MESFDIAFHHATRHGVLTAVHIPDAPEPVPEHILSRLLESEAAFARELKGYRQVQFVGGRLALRRAAEQLSISLPAVLPDERGAPVVPAGFAGSITHKRVLAIGMMARAHEGTLGVDLEEYAPERNRIAPHVLTAGELEAIAPLPPQQRWIATLLRFSIKESIYKALDPYVRRYVGFHEAVVTPDLQGGARVELCLNAREGPFEVDAAYIWLHGRLLTSARIRRADGHTG